MVHAKQYDDRAAWALQYAANDRVPPAARSHLSAAAVHACQSLKESPDQLSEADPANADFADAIKGLPHTELIENVRNMDLHGWPIPICVPNMQMAEIVSKPGKPITLSSS